MSTQASLRIALAQLNFTVGDLESNANKIIYYAKKAQETLKADLIVFPELALTGYLPEDLLLRDDFNSQVKKYISKIQKNIPNMGVIFGCSSKTINKNIPNINCYNKALLLNNNKITHRYSKQLLPNYGVFDEKRYFSPGNKSCIFEIKNVAIGILICEDIWDPDIIKKSIKKGAKLIIVINASPFEKDKPKIREELLKQRCRENNISIIYINTVGGQDELIFDGGSLVINSQGEVCKQACFFEEEILCIDISFQDFSPKKESLKKIPSECELIYKALVLGVRDYVKKNNFQRVLIGLSGGIDSALVAAIAVDAIGKENVETLMMPSRYTSEISVLDAQTISEMLGISHNNISIEPLFTAALNSLDPVFSGLGLDLNKKNNTTEENIQARCRGLLLMAFANKKNTLVLTTSNKSEIAVGYATLYGDMVGGFCILKDVFKTMVYKLVDYRNAISRVIPDRVIQRPPSAELSPNQIDTDALPPYPILDEILLRYIEKNESMELIISAGFDETIVCKVAKMIHQSEHKRRQAPPGPRVSSLGFGRDRRYPIGCFYP